jgi:polar amino acid transport system ATP-binding protein
MSAIVSIQNLHKSFGPNKVLNGVSLEVKQGQMVAIIGRSGSGKSTLLRCLNGLEKVDSGEIRVCGYLVSEPDSIDLRELRKNVGIVFQSYNLFPHLTVERNITLALTTIKKLPTHAAKKIAHEALTLVGLAEKKEAYPEQLSGGSFERGHDDDPGYP